MSFAVQIKKFVIIFSAGLVLFGLCSVALRERTSKENPNGILEIVAQSKVNDLRVKGIPQGLFEKEAKDKHRESSNRFQEEWLLQKIALLPRHIRLELCRDDGDALEFAVLTLELCSDDGGALEFAVLTFS
ncbi:hypothetical protein Tco_1017811 [Tanacetum coccineum]|uniref:Uncharacterized protein n=1 Tax=Tanacetum coccineum TaxID=301880 RepID=A0ABQ5FSL9_9ASTR